jgi:hypothetical protein
MDPICKLERYEEEYFLTLFYFFISFLTDVHYEPSVLYVYKCMTHIEHLQFYITKLYDCLCCLVVRVSGYRSRGPGSTPGATRLFEKWIWNGVHSAL